MRHCHITIDGSTTRNRELCRTFCGNKGYIAINRQRFICSSTFRKVNRHNRRNRCVQYHIRTSIWSILSRSRRRSIIIQCVLSPCHCRIIRFYPIACGTIQCTSYITRRRGIRIILCHSLNRFFREKIVIDTKEVHRSSIIVCQTRQCIGATTMNRCNLEACSNRHGRFTCVSCQLFAININVNVRTIRKRIHREYVQMV